MGSSGAICPPNVRVTSVANAAVRTVIPLLLTVIFIEST
jgi:hypothetical protein